MNLREALRSLGDSPEDVANVLRRNGIKGVRFRPCHCPVARYLVVCGFEKPSVGIDHATALNCSDANVPLAVQRFISSFDNGAYSEFLSLPV